MKILHTADWHVGLKSWRTSKIKDRSDEIKEVVEFIHEKAKENEVDLIIIAGDLLHNRRNPSVEDLDFVVDSIIGFSKLAPVIIVLGNHDWPGLSTYRKFKVKDVYIADNFIPFDIITNSGKVAVYPVPYLRGTAVESREKLKEMMYELFSSIHAKSQKAVADCRITVAHVMVEGTGAVPPQVEERLDAIVQPQWFSNTMDYIALGHVHKKLKISENPPAYYSGSIIQNNFSEEENKGFIIYDADKTELKFIKTPHKKLKNLDLSVLDDPQEIFKTVEAFWEKADYFRIKLNVNLSHIVGKLKEMEKVIEVSLHGGDDKPLFYEGDSGRSFEEVFKEYVELSLKGVIKEKALKMLEKLFKEMKRYKEKA